MTRVAVVAHAEKELGGGLPALRRPLEAEGFDAPLWYEVPKAKEAPKQVERALEDGAELVFAWGGDGTVRRCIGVLAGTKAKLAVLPAGTSNRGRRHALGARPRPHRRPGTVALAARARDEGERHRGRLDRKVRYELDGGDRSKVKSFKVRVEPRVLRVRAPRPGQEKS